MRNNPYKFNMLDNLKKYRVILGSASPRRHEIMKEMGVEFQVYTPDVDELISAKADVAGIACDLALKKSLSFPDEQWTNDTLLITADTIVLLNNIIMGKPAGREDAIQMLTALSGNQHQVITGICVRSSVKQALFCVETTVFFAALSENETAYYVDNYKPYDKAGAYGIQELIGLMGIERIEGSYSNVVGLPARKLYEVLKEF